MVGDGGETHLRATYAEGREDMGNQWWRIIAARRSGCQFHLDFPQGFRRHGRR